jgi:hypothetical protein
MRNPDGTCEMDKAKMPKDLQWAIECYGGACNQLANALAKADPFWRDALSRLAPVLPQLISRATPPKTE